jgi:hypothetical protein
MAVGLPHTEPFTTTGTTSKVVIPAPASGVSHIATRISITNKDSVNHDYTLRLTDTGGPTHSEVQTLSAVTPGQTKTFDQVSGHAATATTREFTIVVNANATTTESAGVASYIENS